MISIIGIGTGASKIAKKFQDIPQYDVYLLNSDVKKNNKNEFQLEVFDNVEDYENNLPNVEKFFKNLKEHIQVFIVGSSKSSIYSLGILNQIKDKKIDIMYIKPDTELLSDLPIQLENLTFGVLQEYARSGNFNTFTVFSNENIEKTHLNINLKNYYSILNETIFSCVHYLNYFEHTEPHIGNVSKPRDINRIRSVGLLDMKSLEEKWLYMLDMPRELCYYLCINEERLEKEAGLHKKLVDILKEKPRNAFRKNSYAIYETKLQDFGFCVAHTNATQQNTFDKLDQE
jgi:hypothetical protein